MAVIKQYPISVDTLPEAVADAYSALLDWLTDWLTISRLNDSPNLIDYFELDLAACETPEIRLRYLSRFSLQGGVNREPYPRAAAELKRVQAEVDLFRPVQYDKSEAHYPYHRREPFHDGYFHGWLAVRLIEDCCAYIGNSTLRSARQNLWAK